MSSHDSEIQKAMHHSAGRGISPVPEITGAGFWDHVKGFAKNVYKFASPIAQKHGRAVAQDILSGLTSQLNSDKRMMEI